MTYDRTARCQASFEKRVEAKSKQTKELRRTFNQPQVEIRNFWMESKEVGRWRLPSGSNGDREGIANSKTEQHTQKGL